MSSEGPYGRQGFQSNPSGYGGNNASYSYGSSSGQPGYGAGNPGYGGNASYGAPPPQGGGYSGGMEYNPYVANTGGGEYEVRYCYTFVDATIHVCFELVWCPYLRVDSSLHDS